MKKRSKLFLIISGAIFLLGAILCLVGLGVASASGEQLYATKKGEDRYYTYSFGDGSTERIKITVTDAHVNVFGGAEKNYIELVNFNENNTTYKSNNASVTFTETAEVDDITGLWESGIGFKGLRHIFANGKKGAEKAVNIYVSDAEVVDSFEIKVQKGNVDISGIKTKTDFSVTIDSGKIKFDNIPAAESITLNAKGDVSTDITFNSVSSKKVEINARRANAALSRLVSDLCDFNINHGRLSFVFVPQNELYSIDIATKGKLVCDNALYTDTYSFTNVPEDDGEDKDEEAEKPPVSSVSIQGEDVSVTLDTPSEDVTAEENTENVTQ